MSLVISPPLTKCTDRALGGRSSRTSVRLLATNDCAMSWPPKVRIGFLLGCDPMNNSSATRLRASVASSSSKSAFGSQPAGTGAPCALEVVLPDPVHVDQVGRAYCARWRARDDDHQVAALVAAQFDQRPVGLPDHLVGGLHYRHDERLGAPGHRELAAYLGPRGEGEE